MTNKKTTKSLIRNLAEKIKKDERKRKISILIAFRDQIFVDETNPIMAWKNLNISECFRDDGEMNFSNLCQIVVELLTQNPFASWLKFFLVR